MAGVERVKHNAKGYRELLTDPKVQADLLARARRIAAAAGGRSAGFVVPEPPTPRKRARAAVIATRGDSDNRMIRNLDAGR